MLILMSKNLVWKFKLLLKSMIVFKNWYILPLVYFGIKKKSKVKFLTKTGKKITIRVAKNSSDIHVLAEVFLENAYSGPRFEINENDIVIDIGAHIGVFTIYASQFCEKGKILCYEPLTENFQILIENIKSNKIKNIKAKNTAVTDKPKRAKFYSSNTDFAAGSLLKKSKNYFEVNTTSIPEIFNENSLKCCNILKLDCEGAEYEILLNLKKEFFQKIEKICMEYHNLKTIPYDENDLVKKLEMFNFKVKKIKKSKTYGYIFAVNKKSNVLKVT